MEERKFRHELKYLINYGDMTLIKLRLNEVMQKDENAINGIYKIRSLYFDDYWYTAYNEKIMGSNKRKKYRIRIYNDSDSLIKLECKQKIDEYICKTSATLTRMETDKIIEGDYSFLLSKENSLCREFYHECISSVMRPCVIVDYEREPFVCVAGDTRVTFDNDVRATNVFKDFFRSDLPSTHVLEPGKVVMEVKYTELLPNIIRNVISCGNSEYTAVSKYVECFEKTNYAFLHGQSGI